MISIEDIEDASDQDLLNAWSELEDQDLDPSDDDDEELLDLMDAIEDECAERGLELPESVEVDLESEEDEELDDDDETL